MTKIKLCGLRNQEAVEVVNRILPDYAGFVFAKKSKRYVTPEEAVLLREQMDPSVKTVGVFVNESLEQVAELLDQGIINIAQLHGQEDEEYIGKLRKLTTEPIFKAFRIESAADVEAANASSADMVLLDAGNGGTGMVFDWELLKNIQRPYILAGGLHPENVEDAVRTLKPYGVDVSSGIETEGIKDPAKMQAFTEAVRRADKE